ncbi:hypothetical protein [Noviherbaspirillum sp.]|uniref:hypothetical protein n=1 Tax=Noviherbaspirillum sp. TaxID=1926288 RepID=UPI002B498B27|nr:hypothetical protein [Noviherbaspirillum sp.]HJV83002.1 hypothetical protein [Noviherbaspirillum sp.]
MPCKRPIPAFIAVCVLGAWPGALLFASDLTIAPTSHPVLTPSRLSAKPQHPPKPVLAAKKHALAKSDKDRRSKMERQQRILTYNLFRDPVLKLGGAVSDKRHFGLGDGRSVSGGGFGTATTLDPILRIRDRAASDPGSPLKMAPVDGEGIAFDCQDKPFAAIPRRSSFTACFKQKLDRSWKTQTYVSGARADGSLNWGGGMAFGYDY